MIHVLSLSQKPNKFKHKKKEQNIYCPDLLAVYRKASGLNILIFKWLCAHKAKVIFPEAEINIKSNKHEIKIHLGGLVAYKILINHLL